MARAIGLRMAEALDHVAPDDAAVARIHNDPEGVAFATAEIGIDATAAFDDADTVKALGNDRTACAAADPARADADDIAFLPIRLRIIPAIVEEPEGSAPAVPALMVVGIELP